MEENFVALTDGEIADLPDQLKTRYAQWATREMIRAQKEATYLRKDRELLALRQVYTGIRATIGRECDPWTEDWRLVSTKSILHAFKDCRRRDPQLAAQVMLNYFGFANNRALEGRVRTISGYIAAIIEAGNNIAHPKKRKAFQEADRSYTVDDIVAMERRQFQRANTTPILPPARRLQHFQDQRHDLMIGAYVEWRRPNRRGN